MSCALASPSGLPDDWWERAQAVGDLQLKLRDGQEIRVLRGLLMLASPVIAEALQLPGPVPKELPVQGSHESWTELLKFLYHPAFTGQPRLITLEAALKVLPVAHTYGMASLLTSFAAMLQDEQCKLPLGPPRPEAPATATQAHGQTTTTANQQPTLFQWLCQADNMQCMLLVDACLHQLDDQVKGASEVLHSPVLRSALSSRANREQLQQLRPSSYLGLLNTAAGLPIEYEGLQLPDLQATPTLQQTTEANARYRSTVGCMDGSLVFWARDDANSIEAVHIELGTSCQLTNGLTARALAVDAKHCGGAQLALVGCSDGSVHLFDVSSRACRQSLAPTAQGGLMRVRFVGQQHCASSVGGAIRVADLATMQQTASLTASEVYGLAASSDGRLLLMGGAATGLWDLRTQKLVGSLTGHGGYTYSVAVDAEGRLAATGSADKTARTWDLRTLRCQGTLSGHTGGPYVLMDSAGTAAFTYCTQAAGGTVGGTVKLWDLSRSVLTSTHACTEAGGGIISMAASADLSSVAALCRETQAADTPVVAKIWAA